MACALVAAGAPVVAAEAAGDAAAGGASALPSRVVAAVSRTRRLPSLIRWSLSPGSTARQQPERARRGEVDAQSRLAAGPPAGGDLRGLVEAVLRAEHGERRGQAGRPAPATRGGDDDLPV